MDKHSLQEQKPLEKKKAQERHKSALPRVHNLFSPMASGDWHQEIGMQ